MPLKPRRPSTFKSARVALPLRKRDVWALAVTLVEPTFLDRSDWDDFVYFAVEDGELIVSTEPLGDDPGERLVINHEPLQQGAEDLEGLRDWLAQGGSDNTL